MLLNNLQRQKTILSLNDSNNLLLSINRTCMEFCFISVVWWFFDDDDDDKLYKQSHFAHFGKRQKLVSLLRLKIGLGMSNIELK